MLYKNRYTFLSLILLCGMYMIFNLYYSPESAVRKGVAMVGGEGQAHIGGEFDLVDGSGKPFTQKNLIGKMNLLFFGFTFCPDICPQGLSTMGLVYNDLPEDMHSNVQVIFVSVDPERDTPQVIKPYVEAFNENFIGLTGTKEQVKKAADAYLVYYAKDENATGDDYLVSHSGYIYLMGPDGKYIKHFSHKSDVQEISSTLKTLLQK